MGPRTWPDDWEQRRRGVGCEMCAERDTDVDGNGNRRFHAGRVSGAYLHRLAPQPGYGTVRWRGRHVVDPSELTVRELSDYWVEVMVIARAMTEVFQPCHLNYEVLGNTVPHLHTHIVARYADDHSPGTPLKPWELHQIPDTELERQVARLRDALHEPS